MILKAACAFERSRLLLIRESSGAAFLYILATANTACCINKINEKHLQAGRNHEV